MYKSLKGGYEVNTDIRWKQRFQNYEKALQTLQEALARSELSTLERAGVIQIYEFTFELGWKTLKDFLEARDIPVKYPRDVIKEAFQYEIIDDGETWLSMLQERNIIAHTYNEATAGLVLDNIMKKYITALTQVYHRLCEER